MLFNRVVPQQVCGRKATGGLPQSKSDRPLREGVDDHQHAANIAATSPELAELIALWPGLPVDVRAEVITLARLAASALPLTRWAKKAPLGLRRGKPPSLTEAAPTDGCQFPDPNGLLG